MGTEVRDRAYEANSSPPIRYTPSIQPFASNHCVFCGHVEARKPHDGDRVGSGNSSQRRSRRDCIVGCEGMSGTAIVLGADRSPHSTYIQLKGTGQKLAAGDLRKAMESPTMQKVLLKFAQAFAIQTAKHRHCQCSREAS
jgi:hypothetical protein